MLVDRIAETRTLLRSAVIEHLYQWWARDGLLYRRLRLPDGQIDPAVLRKIARAYGVSRGILEGQEASVGKLIVTNLGNWPDDLVARAHVVRRIADEAKGNLTRGLLLSAFSKLVWFVRPQGWTLYDSYARAGLNAPRNGDDFDSYYIRLQDISFQMAMDLSRDVIARSAFPYLHPERIHDAYLMLCNKPLPDTLPMMAHISFDDILDLWVAFHGPSMRDKVEALVSDLASEITDKPAFQVHTKEVN